MTAKRWSSVNEKNPFTIVNAFLQSVLLFFFLAGMFYVLMKDEKEF